MNASEHASSIKGRIHSFESFSALDGPGIRYVIFFSGCQMRCIFCHNVDMRESIPGTYNEYSVAEVIKRVERAKPFFTCSRSGGGITLSGGEPFFQFEFMLNLLKECKRLKIHTVVDTNLYTSPMDIGTVSKWVDLFLVGLKHIDNQKHMELTGKDNTAILKNISFIDSIKKPFWLRYVVIPGITDNEKDIRQLATFLSDFNHLEQVELLPYHCLGLKKWEALGKPYALPDVKPPTAEEMSLVKEVFQAFDLPVDVGDVEVLETYL